MRNNLIDLFRLVCSIMVVAIHTAPFSEFGESTAFWTTEIIPRIAVPYFFAVSGFFYTKKLQHHAPLLPYIRKLLLTYLLWSIPYFVLSFLTWGYRSPLSFPVECVYAFFVTGSSYHFWFFPALFISIGITTLLWKLRCVKGLIPLSIAAYIIGCLGCSHFRYGIQIPYLSTLYCSAQFTLIRRIFFMGFPFFICGYVVRLVFERFDHKIRPICTIAILVISIFLWGFELYWIVSRKLYSSIVISPMLYPLVAATLFALLNNTSTIPEPVVRKCRAAANFMYYAHPLSIMLLELIPYKIEPTLIFVLTIGSTSLIGILLSKRKERIVSYLIG